MFSSGFNPSSNLGFGNRFRLDQAYSPTLAKNDMTPGVVQLMQQPMPTPAGGAAPGMASTANGINSSAGGPAFGPLASNAQAATPGFNPAVISWPGMGAPMQQQQPAGGANAGGLSQGQMGALAQLGGGLLSSAHQQPPPVAPVSMPAGPGVTPSNDALARLLSMYGIRGGVLA